MNYHKKYNSFYNSPEWKALRELKFGEANGLCEKCLKANLIEEGKEVHHIKSVAARWDLRLDYNNLILLCKRCHDKEHERVSLLEKFLKEWEGI